MIKWDKPCYKCLSHFCDLSCKEPKHLQAPQPKEPEQDQDEVDIRSRLYQRIHELETQLAQPTSGDYALGYSIGFGEGHSAGKALAQPEQKYGVVAGVGKGVEIPAGVKYYYIEPKLPPQPKEPEQEPVAWRFTGIAGLKRYMTQKQYDAQTPETKKWYEPFRCANCITPPQRKPLTDEQMWVLWNSQGDDAMEQQAAIAFARAIEAAHGIKGEA